MNILRRRARFLLQFGLLSGALMSAGLISSFAQIAGYPPTIEGYDPREVAMLPPYCMYTQVFRDRVPGGSNQAEIDRWRNLLGPGFQNLHHYCWGLMASNRAISLATNPGERANYLSRSIGEFEYVIRGSPPGFVLLPEIFTKRGENLLRMDRVQEGIADLQQATELKADYWPPYVALSDYYKKVKNIVKAKEWLEKGLQASPGTRGLQQRLQELGGSSR